MNTKEESLHLMRLQIRISELRTELNTLLEEERSLVSDCAKDEGCTCGFMVLDYRVTRVSNYFCKSAHKNEKP